MPDRDLPPIFSRHWTEYTLAVAAIIIAGISLWVAVDTEYTNRKLVAEASWPFLAIDYSNRNGEGQPVFSLDIANRGIGPARIETLEVFWKGKPYRSARDLLNACCKPKPGQAGNRRDKSGNTAAGPITATSAGTVLRAGQILSFIRFALTPYNAATWHAVDSQKDNFSYRVCFCSVFNECWLSDGKNLDPPRVAVCPRPGVPYNN
ncbi:MAG: hypothetical protein ACREHF_14345 [Rhizomicrobium sp.]